MEITVKLKLCDQWEFTTVYPIQKIIDNSITWNLLAKTDGTLVESTTKKEYSYLFWEADTFPELHDQHPLFSSSSLPSSSSLSSFVPFHFEKTKTYCIKSCEISNFLDDCLMKLGLNIRERNDFITYWLSDFQLDPFYLISFLVNSPSYESSAMLTVFPTPDFVLRIFMIFQGMNQYIQGCQPDSFSPQRQNEIEFPRNNHQFVVVEWGGMNLNGHHIS